jgi:lipopolysaccharide export LptBFGC system permease protein LptF
VNSTILNVCPKDTTFGILQVEGLQVPSARLTSRRALQKPSLQELSRGGILRLIAELQTKLHTKNQNRGGRQFSFDLTEAGIGDTSHIHCQECGEKKEIVTSSAKESKSHNVNRSDEDELVKLECFLHQRDAAIFSCIVYCLMGAMATLVQGSRPASSGSRASPIAWALLSSMIYNMIVATAAFAGMSRHLTPLLSAWIPPLIGLSLSFFLPVILRR